MRMSFFIFLIFNATNTFAKETFLECTIQGKKTTLTNTISEVIISPSKASVKISEIKDDLFIFVQGPEDELTTVGTRGSDSSGSYQNLSNYSEYFLINATDKVGTSIKINRASGGIQIEKDYNLKNIAFSQTRLYGSCNKIDKLKF